MKRRLRLLSPFFRAVLIGSIFGQSAWAEVRPDATNHWAFKPPIRPEIPTVKSPGWGRNGLDSFIQSRLDKEGLVPSPEADNGTWLRRVYLDLIGLPPTPSEIDAFLKDHSPGAYESVVDRLLISPHYGERWGRIWLDAARYADSDGFEKDKPRFVWAYRDWVVDAFNRDLPYDQFIIEQLAGDLLPQATDDQKVATGFLRNSMLNEEGGVDPEQFRMESMFDRMDCLGKSVLGLTIQCAQCHNHKFDPISQEEYYRLFAFLNNDHEGSMVAYTPREQMQVANLRRQIQDLEEGLRHRTPEWQSRMHAWEDAVRTNQPEWVVITAEHQGENGERFYSYADGSIRAASYAPTFWTAHFQATNLPKTIRSIGAFRLEQLTDPNLPCNGPGRSVKGMSALTEFRVEILGASTNQEASKVKFVSATADYSNQEKELEPEFDDRSGKKRTYGPVAFAIDGKEETAWGIDAGPGRRNQARKAVFTPEHPIEITNATAVLNIYLDQKHGGWNSDDNQNHNLGRFRFSVTASTNVVADPVPDTVRKLLQIARDERTPAQVAVLFSYWRTTVPEFASVNQEIERLTSAWPEGTPTSVFVAHRGTGPGEELRDTRILKRGDWLKPSESVQPGVPAVLHPLPPNAEPSRLTLAKWLVDRKSPTTARVCVNRIWQSYFGTGLVETAEDFGLQSPAPSHPELLDWLACELMDGGWRMKAIHRLIVLSSTYRQSSKVTPELSDRDKYNRLLARGPRFRVDAEVVRDIALSASGLLNPALGGRGVYPPAPDFLFQPPTSYGPKTWKEEKGPDRYRRSIYVFKFRSVPYPVLANFDAPNGDFSCVRRNRSNTPLQALTALNEIVFNECARALAGSVLASPASSDEERISTAFRRVLGRWPTPEERVDLLSLLSKAHQRIADGWVHAGELATGKAELPRQLPAGTTPAQLAAYTAVSRALLNLDETLTKE